MKPTKSYLIFFIPLIAASYYFGFEASKFGIQNLPLAFKLDGDLWICLLVALLSAVSIIWVTSSNNKYSIKSFFQKHITKFLVFALILIAGTGGFENNEPRVYNIKLFGAQPATRAYDFVTTNGSTTVTSATGGFTNAIVGYTILINGAGSGGNVLRTTISSVTNSTTIVVALAASATTSSDTTIYGKDNTIPLQNAIAACQAGGGGKIIVPVGTYIFSSALSGAGNAQISIPVNAGGTSQNKVVIAIEGETVYGGSASGYLVGFPAAVQTRGVIFYSTITGSGVMPCFIGSGDASTRNRNDFSISNIGIMVYTNHGASAVSVMPVNGLMFQKINATRNTFSPDIEVSRTVSPASSEVAGIIVGATNDNGENVISENQIVGFKYGVVAGEHTLLNGNLIYANINGLAIPAGVHPVTGNSQIFACVNEIYSPTITIFGMSAGGASVNIINESEWDTTTALIGTAWYKSVNNVSDSNSNLSGAIRINIVANGANANTIGAHTYGVDVTKLSVSTYSNPYAFLNVAQTFIKTQTIKPATSTDAIHLVNPSNTHSNALGKSDQAFGIVASDDSYYWNDGNGDLDIMNSNSSGKINFGNSTNILSIDNTLRLSTFGTTGAGGSIFINPSTTLRDGGWNQALEIQANATNAFPSIMFSGLSGSSKQGGVVWTRSTSGNTASSQQANFFGWESSNTGIFDIKLNGNIGTTGTTTMMRIYGTTGIAIGGSGFTPTKTLDISGTLKASGAVQFSNYGAGTATFDASGNITSVSDVRLKNVLGDYNSGLKELMNLKPILYKWNKLSGNEMDSTYAGFSAQNAQANIPYGTGVNKDGYLSLQDRAIMATMVNAIKEQQKEIEDLKKEIKALKKK